MNPNGKTLVISLAKEDSPSSNDIFDCLEAFENSIVFLLQKGIDDIAIGSADGIEDQQLGQLISCLKLHRLPIRIYRTFHLDGSNPKRLIDQSVDAVFLFLNGTGKIPFDSLTTPPGLSNTLPAHLNFIRSLRQQRDLIGKDNPTLNFYFILSEKNFREIDEMIRMSIAECVDGMYFCFDHPLFLLQETNCSSSSLARSIIHLLEINKITFDHPELPTTNLLFILSTYLDPSFHHCYFRPGSLLLKRSGNLYLCAQKPSFIDNVLLHPFDRSKLSIVCQLQDLTCKHLFRDGNCHSSDLHGFPYETLQSVIDRLDGF